MQQLGDFGLKMMTLGIGGVLAHGNLLDSITQ
jgi:hypothetical protein